MSDLPAPSAQAPTDEHRLPPQRGRYEGVLNIVRFNWPLYAVGVLAVAITLCVAVLLDPDSWPRWALVGTAVLLGYLLLASLIASHWIYDRSNLYRFDWVSRHISADVAHVINLHAGFDETSPTLRQMFPSATLEILDFYDPLRMTEPSIVRARRRQERVAPRWVSSHTVSVNPQALPVASDDVDAVFAVLALHEVRIAGDRQSLFFELTRALRPGGRILLLEHLRDPINFIAFGPQFVHFYSRRTWIDLAHNAGLSVEHESRLTPFVGFFVFEKPRRARS